MNVESPSMDYTSNKGSLHRAQCTGALIYTALADKYLLLLLIFSYDLYCKSVRLFVCSCSFRDGKLMCRTTQSVFFFLYSPLTPKRQKVSEVCSCCWFVISRLRRWSTSFMSILLPQVWPQEKAGPVHCKCGSMPLMNRNALDCEIFVDHNCSQVTVSHVHVFCCAAARGVVHQRVPRRFVHFLYLCWILM